MLILDEKELTFKGSRGSLSTGDKENLSGNISEKVTVTLILVLFSCLYTDAVSAKNWNIQPVISIQETYNDNITLAPSGREQGDLISSITPSLRLNREGRRLDLQLDYNLQGLFYLDNSENDDYFHSLNVNSQSEIVDDHLFVDFNLKLSPQNTNNTGNTALDNLSVTNDRSDVLTYEVSPRWEQRFGNFSNLKLLYKRDEIDSDTLSGSTSDNFEFVLSSGARFSRFLWDLRIENEKINNDVGPSSRFTKLLADIRYPITRKVALKFSLGKDRNKFSSNGGDIDGLLWNVGAVWSPSTRTSLEATVGERFFGSDIFVELSHRTRRTRWQASFTREPSTTRTSLLDQQVFNLIDNFGVPIIDPIIGDQAILNTSVPVQTSEVLIRSRFSGNVNYTLRKHEFEVDTYHEELDFQLAGDRDESLGIGGSWIWNIGSRTQSVLSIEWDKQSLRGGVDDTYTRLNYTINHRLTPDLSGNIGIRYSIKEANISESEYDEARVFIGLSRVF